MDSLTSLWLATLAFTLTHFVSSTPLRPGLLRAIGEKGYMAIYNLVALVTFAWMIYAFVRAPVISVWNGAGLRWIPLVVMPFALALLAGGFMVRNPSLYGMQTALQREEPARGMLRLTRHPIMWAVALLSLSHMLATGRAASLIFFGGFALVALLGTVLIDARKRRELGEGWQRFAAVTSNVPFAAIAAGRNRFVWREIMRPVIAGIVLYAVLLVVHPYLFGVRSYG